MASGQEGRKKWCVTGRRVDFVAMGALCLSLAFDVECRWKPFDLRNV